MTPLSAGESVKNGLAGCLLGAILKGFLGTVRKNWDPGFVRIDTKAEVPGIELNASSSKRWCFFEAEANFPPSGSLAHDRATLAQIIERNKGKVFPDARDE
jgi:hypothetical protein